MKNLFIILGFIIAFIAGYFISQKYNLKIENKNITPTPTIENTFISPTTGTQTIPTVQPTETDEEKIRATILENHGWNPSEVDITISQNNGQFARGGIKEKSAISGGMFLAMKKNDEWTVVFEGNGAPDCMLLKTTYLFPAELLVGICD